jgi:hypothetical protein
LSSVTASAARAAVDEGERTLLFTARRARSPGEGRGEGRNGGMIERPLIGEWHSVRERRIWVQLFLSLELELELKILVRYEDRQRMRLWGSCETAEKQQLKA